MGLLPRKGPYFPSPKAQTPPLPFQVGMVLRAAWKGLRPRRRSEQGTQREPSWPGRDTKPSHAKGQMFLWALGLQRPEVQSLGQGSI